jgi:hypothetical protein
MEKSGHLYARHTKEGFEEYLKENEDKKEMLRNLLESEIPEEMIAEQLDLDMQTVKKLIREMRM